jgi:membrane dipeptidase
MSIHSADGRSSVRDRYPHFKDAWDAGLRALKPTHAQLERGLDLHSQSTVIDTFGFLPQVWSGRLVQHLQELQSRGVAGNDWHFQSSVLRQTIAADDAEARAEFADALALAGLDGLVQTVAEGKSRDEDYRRMAGFAHLIRSLDQTLGHATSAQQFEAIRKQDRTAVFWSCNGPPVPGHLRDLDEELALVETWRHLGVRLMHLTYNRRNVIGDGCAEAANGGLSDLGRDLVARLNQAGIIVDVPHCGEQTCLDAAVASSRPIMASHTGCKPIYDHIRTKSDRVLKAIADTGGLVGIVAVPTFIGRSGDINALLDHVDHAVRLIGADHVSIGTDLTASGPWPAELNAPAKTSFSSAWWGSWKPHRDHAARPKGPANGGLSWTNWPLFTVGLVQRGYGDAEIQKILGGNFLRVIRAHETQ